ncbi:putative mitochondrial hypothetical protein [Leptomonas pyrrhocoris]|uniref:Mitochondrial carrier protein n=1 Tax=Leptomonas pyrrhocoris TaxID=157538 RepID=A0A0N0VHK9_LEPPY|nr:putative mitochondrial hypothetical protein [Leptomonas pyrrhocoris]XP_015664498.1 putative mitochondrial hypothetical protein [Leptomonas pyrrhocoris]KPA86058.1 putative mitochondrial hypothetical protein [Leptomonas pyrrhocoris]KPA86059.1 putative mitochondrial hypothetical protein [Leptomonas pyrrhocoris]|eukprot:XP_015664497.1 putative mitochondrial hypothetical protein [Leptomonas pyrrhocoris]
MLDTPLATNAPQVTEAELRKALQTTPLHKVKNFTAATVAADCITSVAVALTAAVPISIIDYSIMARVARVTDSSIKEMWKGAKTVVLRPHKFFLPCAENKCSVVYRACATTYAFTYISSNLTKSYFESHGMEKEANLAAGISSGVANTVFSIWKDSLILRALPPVGAKDLSNATRPVPFLTRALFCGRDTLTCVGAFTLAPMVGAWISGYAYHQRYLPQAPDAVLPENQGKTRLLISCVDTAQIITPALLQLVTTLLHITAIRYRQAYPNFNMKDLTESLRKTYISSTLLRMGRIIPAFGFGGIMNRDMRSSLLDKAEPNTL